MPLSAATRLGPYEVVAPIGAGGMGEVYRAKDTRLDREVAVKILPEGFAADEQRRARFEREAKAISSLNHPNICTLYDVGHENGTHYLVMELLEGEPLADRIAKGPLPPEQVLRFGAQVADALECAHKHGVVHRDLKPGNVVITKTGAKLLDFGLARAAADGTGSLSGSSDLATAAKPLTEQGTIVGTFRYMAPEQLEGHEADPRTDIFALGALLFEMATGKHAFEGKSRTSLIAAIVSSQPPPISSVVPMCPPALDHIVRKCLEKDADERWQSAHDVAEELRWIAEAGSQAGVASKVAVRRKTRESLAWALAALGAVAAIGLGVALARSRAMAPAAFRASLPPPPGTALVPFDLLGLALAPDGRSLAFVALARDGSKQIWIRDFASFAARAVPETQGATYPFWSPDGRYLGFFADGKLKKIDLRGGSPQVLADAPTGRGGSWSKGDVVLFASNIRGPIQSIPASGGAPTPVTRFDAAKETSHRWPTFLPDGRHFLYMSRGRIEGKAELGRIVLGSLDSPEPTILAEDATNAAFVPPDRLLYGRSANLLAQRFDLRSLRLVGEPVTVLEEKLAYWEAKNLVVFAASDDGSLVYLPGASRPSVLTWYDRSGRTLGTVGEAGSVVTARLSPDGKRIASVRGDAPKSDIWIHDLEYDRAVRFTFRSGLYVAPRWSHDASRLMFGCQPKLVQDICTKSLRDAGDIEPLVEGPNWKTAGGWLADGSVVYDDQNPETNVDLLIAPPDGKGEARVLLRTPFDEQTPEPSPDARFVAYTSDETGRAEVYVRPSSGAPQQWQISTGGGEQPRWRGDGKELFFTTPDGKLMAAAIESVPSFRPGSPKALFTLPEPPNYLLPLFEDVTADGQRFLLNLPTESAASVGFRVVLHWRALTGDR